MRDSSRRYASRAWWMVGLGVLVGLPAASPPLAPEVQAQEVDQSLVADIVAGLPLREIGPALMGGRIADIAVHPHRSSTWYIAVGSGGVWKTTNAGVTWDAIFEDESVYSIGDVAIDPNNPDVIWVGTGENVSGRHVGWGDGVYRSRNGGETWENVGLPTSEHIGKILVDPRDSDVILVAAEGSLWAAGGERGVYKSTDGGDSWRLVLGIDENTGVTDIEFAPGNPDMIYAAAYERRRKIWGHLAGGPNSGIYKSSDGGEGWRRITAGLPGRRCGKDRTRRHPGEPRGRVRDHGGERRRARLLPVPRQGGELGAAELVHLRGHGSPLLPGDRSLPAQRGRRVPDGRLHPGHAGRGRDVREPRDGARQAQRQPRPLGLSRGPAAPAGGDGRRPVRELRRRPHLPSLPEPAHLAVLQARARQRGAVLQRARRGAGSRHAVGSRPHDERRRGPEPGLVRADGGGRVRGPDRPAGSGHPLPADAAGEPLPLRPEERGGARHPGAARARRPARTLELGLARPHQSARRRPNLPRLAARVGERRPGQLVDRDQRRPDDEREPLRAGVHGAGVERRRPHRQRRHVEVRDPHGDLRVAGHGGRDLHGER